MDAAIAECRAIPVAYPYAAELAQCGSLRTYELVFASGSDQMSGTDWPILSAVAETLKQNAGMKIQIAGHTDSTGDAKANQTLSDRRAATVKRILSEKYGADAARVTTKGWGGGAARSRQRDGRRTRAEPACGDCAELRTYWYEV